MTTQTFATPRNVRFEDCDFYHTVELPGHGVVQGQWDLRGKVDEYFGHYKFAGKRVLEIGPASGFLTFEMEKREAEVVALEVPDDPGWDFVPFPDEMMAPIFGPRRVNMDKIKNSFWFLHEVHGSRARLCYGDSYDMPDLGRFDAAVLASVLLHCERPTRVIAECAKRADTLIVTEAYKEDLEGSAVCRLVPRPTRFTWDTWWEFSTTFFEQFFGVLGFAHTAVTRHEQVYSGVGPVPFFTVIGSKHLIDEIASSNGIDKTLSRNVVTGVLGSSMDVSGSGMSDDELRLPRTPATKSDVPIPTPELRHRVTGSESADVFLTSGEQSRGDLIRALAGVGRQLGSFERVLEWGCGCGRVTRWLSADLEDREFFGVDIDPLAIGWCARHLPFGQFMVCKPRPPLDFPDNHFDLVVNHSVLSHLDASMQDDWLAEFRRITRPGGLVILSIHGDGAFATLAADWATERAAERRNVLERAGILYVTEDYVGSPFPDFYQNTFHATWYVFSHWPKYLPIIAYYPRGALLFQDIVVLKRPTSDDEPHSPVVPAGNRPTITERSSSGLAHHREYLQRLVDVGPQLNQPTRYGIFTYLMRRIMRRASANLRAHQQEIDCQLILALGDLEQTISRLDYGQLMIRDGISRQSQRIARLENQVTELLEARAGVGSAPCAAIPSENREPERAVQHARSYEAKLAAALIDVSKFDIAPLTSDPGVKYAEIAPGAYSAPMPPSFVLGPFPEYLTRMYFGEVNTQPVGCYYVEGARVTSHGLLIRDGTLLVNDQLPLSRETIAIASLFGPICATRSVSRFVDEPVALVIGPGHLVYGHWLADVLPRLYLLHRAGIDPLGVKYIIPKDTPAFGFAWLRLVGISDSQLILFDPYTEVIGVKDLIMPTLLHTRARAHLLFPQATEYLLSLIRRAHRVPTVARQHLFVSRAVASPTIRKLANRETIERLAAEGGFKIYRPEAFSLVDQLATFASATSIVGEYGSALHASIFSPPNTAVLALRSNAMHPGFLQSGLCQVMRQKIAYIFGAAGKDDIDKEFLISEDDFKIGLQWFKDLSL